jgi:cation diffusion facilitator CzcD-associated flavoprotein CzcO
MLERAKPGGNMTDRSTTTTQQPLTAVIVGTGFGGIGMAIKLRQAGITDFVMLEKSDQIGGTWRDNTYPGAACDVPSPLYSFSFEQDFDWPRFYSGQKDIHRYQQHCVTKYKLTPHVRLNTEVRCAAFDERRGLWQIETVQGDIMLARALITATGQLNRPAYPKIPGLDSFRGRIFHSSRWDHAHDLSGRRVGVVGTGASAIQFLAPVAERAGQVTLFQRTAPYVLPKPDRKITRAEHWMHRNIPLARKLVRGTVYSVFESLGVGLLKFRPALAPLKAAWAAHLRLTIKDPALRAKLTPDYPIGCKRILFDNTYYRALARPNVNVETGDIKQIGENHVVTVDGTRHEIDTLILGTGFAASGFLAPMEIRGRGNRELSAAWRDGAEAYLGITVSGFPNLFMLYGPNTNLGHNSIVYMLESQIQYVKDAIANLRAAPGTSFDVKSDVQNSFNAKLQHALRNTVWAEGCKSWYIAESGKIVNNWSGFTFTYRRLTSRFDAVNYHALVPSRVAQRRDDMRQAMPLQLASATA